MNFVAIDVETANADLASICQIGIARYSEGQLVEQWSSLIDPEDYFCPMNIDIHGITQDMVKCSPTFPEVGEILRSFLNNTVCVCHTHFDRVSVGQAHAKYNLRKIETVWLDSARVARRTWKDCAWRDYGLSSVCQRIGYSFKHHDALEDAKASAHVLLAAINETGMDIHAWLKRVDQPIDPTNSSCGSAVNRVGNPDGEYRGEVIVFTGALDIPRKDAADLAASVGFTVASGVNKNTTMLVVGDQDVVKLLGRDKSTKHLKAEQLITKGQRIRIIKESDFKELINHARPSASSN